MIRYSALAAADLRSYSRRITSDNGVATAERVIGRMIAAIEGLERFPHLGRPGRRQGTRELVIAGLPFIVIYRLTGGDVIVARVIHGAMQWPPVR